MNNKKKYQIFCDMDGVLVDYIGGVILTMNNRVHDIANNLNLYKTKHPKIYKAAKKAVEEMGGDLENGILGHPFEEEDVQKGTDKKKVRNLMYVFVSNDLKFWTNLDWMPDGKILWTYISRHNPTVLTGPQGPNSKIGKVEWCKRELGIGKDRIVITHTKNEEATKALKKGIVPVLIDDLTKYIAPFRNAGGIAIQHTDTANTIEQLKKLGL